MRNSAARPMFTRQAHAEGEFREILEYADHIVFNSFTQ